METIRFNSMYKAINCMIALYPELERKTAELWILDNECGTDYYDNAIFINPSMYNMPVEEVDTDSPEPERPRYYGGRPGKTQTND